MKTVHSCESLNEYWSPKCGSAEIKHYQRVIRPDVLRYRAFRIGNSSCLEKNQDDCKILNSN
jgi:hypothetical protein